MIDNEGVTTVRILSALHFAAEKHRDQRRKGAEASPYINHPIEVAEVIARRGGVTDPVVLQAAILHDTLEDTRTTHAELESVFGREVADVVLEVTDDKALPSEERKRLQVTHAAELSTAARLVKLGDKIANVRAVAHQPARGWGPERRHAYLDWAEQVIAGCRGCNAALEQHFDEVLAASRASIDVPEAPEHS
jgi:guanosine-3',5'-bis(diphosphate) 3'-pyrophosphohydrolase